MRQNWMMLIRSCLKQEKVTFNHNAIINLHIVYEMNLWPLE